MVVEAGASSGEILSGDSGVTWNESTESSLVIKALLPLTTPTVLSDTWPFGRQTKAKFCLDLCPRQMSKTAG